MKEVKIFILNQKIYIMLISETHLIEKHYFKVSSYSKYHTPHPTEHGDIIIIKNNVWHHKLDKFKRDFLQNTTEN
jgi:hypothetical protein